MSEVEVEVEGPERDMDSDEAELAARLYGAIMDQSRYSERSMQSAGYKAGVSDLGYCSERLRRMLDRQEPEDRDELTAFIGTALGDHMEQAWAKHLWPDAIVQAEVTLELIGESGNVYQLPGHPDIIVPSEGLLIDGKSVNGFSLVRRMGPSDSQQFQRHGYAYAAHEAGLFGDLPLNEVRVANAWIDRAGIEQSLHVDMEPFNPEIVRDAARWLDDVVYAYTHEEEARKEPAREVCAVTCGFFKTCRAYDTDVSGLITDPATLAAIELYREGTALQSKGKKIHKEVKPLLKDIEGFTEDGYSLRHVFVPESIVKEYLRRSYTKVQLTKVKK
jgi:hypothetical protein